MTIRGTLKPTLFSYKVEIGQRIATFCSFIEETPEGFKWKEYTLPPEVWNYDAIVNAIISEEYGLDKMQAIVNNYLLDPGDVTIKDEFTQMQNFRKLAKEKALEIFKYVEDNNLW